MFKEEVLRQTSDEFLNNDCPVVLVLQIFLNELISLERCIDKRAQERKAFYKEPLNKDHFSQIQCVGAVYERTGSNQRQGAVSSTLFCRRGAMRIYLHLEGSDSVVDCCVDFPLDCSGFRNPHQNSGTEKRHTHQEFRQNPPSQTTPGPIFPFKLQEKRPNIRISKGGVCNGAQNFLMLKFFVCFICTWRMHFKN